MQDTVAAAQQPVIDQSNAKAEADSIARADSLATASLMEKAAIGKVFEYKHFNTPDGRSAYNLRSIGEIKSKLAGLGFEKTGRNQYEYRVKGEPMITVNLKSREVGGEAFDYTENTYTLTFKDAELTKAFTSSWKEDLAHMKVSGTKVTLTEEFEN